MASPSRPTTRLASIARHMSSGAAAPPEAAAPRAEEASEVLHEAQDGIRFITLNRPKALNALNLNMINIIQDLLSRYHESQDTAAIVLQGEGRAFCAGGDVVSLIKAAQSEDANVRAQAPSFFQAEYALDLFLAKMRKPAIAILDGIVMGGGVGLSIHLPFRIVTEKTIFAMPETTIGLFPDVGSSFFLCRMDGQLGRYLGLTSEQLKGYQAYHAGVGTHFVPSANLDDVRRRLIELSNTQNVTYDAIDNIIEEYGADPSFLREEARKNPPLTGSKRRAIDTCFRHRDAEVIIDELRKVEKGRSSEFEGKGLEEWAKGIADTIEKRSPTSVKVALHALRDARQQTIDQVFHTDMHLAATFCVPSVAPDFVTGVTHQMITKDRVNRAAWSPATLKEVDLSWMRKTFFGAKPVAGVTVPSLPTITSNDDSATFDSFKSYPEGGRGLPSEAHIRARITGEYKDASRFAPTRKEVTKALQREYPRASGKLGLEDKVAETIERMCSSNDGQLTWDKDIAGKA